MWRRGHKRTHSPYLLEARMYGTACGGNRLGLGADQKVVGNLLWWQRGDGRPRHRDIGEVHQSNAGGVTYEGASQQRGTKGEHGSYVAVEGADAGYVVRELKTAVAAALVKVQG
jgi:hypothetical protein